MSSCDRNIEVTNASQKGVLRKLLVLNEIMFVAEFIAGITGESTGVLADSLDMLADSLVYGVALYAVGRCSSIKTKPAFLSGGFQILIALGIAADIIRRAITSSDPSSLLIFFSSPPSSLPRPSNKTSVSPKNIKTRATAAHCVFPAGLIEFRQSALKCT